MIAILLEKNIGQVDFDDVLVSMVPEMEKEYSEPLPQYTRQDKKQHTIEYGWDKLNVGHRNKVHARVT